MEITGEIGTTVPLIRLTACIIGLPGQLISFPTPLPPSFLDALILGLHAHIKLVRLDDSLSQDRAILNLFL